MRRPATKYEAVRLAILIVLAVPVLCVMLLIFLCRILLSTNKKMAALRQELEERKRE